MRLLVLIATAAFALAAPAVAAAPKTFKATLTAATHTPKADNKTHWPYQVKVTDLKGKPLAGKVTIAIVDPVGGVHPVQFGANTEVRHELALQGRLQGLGALAAGVGGRGRAQVPRDGEDGQGQGGADLPRHAARMSAPPGGAEVVVEHVRKGFEDGRIHALEDISLRIEPGEFVLLTGASGLRQEHAPEPDRCARPARRGQHRRRRAAPRAPRGSLGHTAPPRSASCSRRTT